MSHPTVDQASKQKYWGFGIRKFGCFDDVNKICTSYRIGTLGDLIGSKSRENLEMHFYNLFKHLRCKNRVY